MEIYVVKEGDSLWSISRRYGISEARISEANGLQTIPYLVIGQALVIPSKESIYIVMPGDTIWSISRKYNVSIESIVELNNITNPNTIHPGMTIRIPAQAKNYGYIETNGYIEPSTSERETRIVNEVGRYLTFISPFSYQVSSNGSLISINDNVILQNARNYSVASLMVITNYRNGTFDTALGHEILSNDTVINNLINNVLGVLRSKGYYGLNIDFERIDPNDRQLYNNFLRKITNMLHQQNYIVTTALAPKTSDAQTGAWYGAHDYATHGKIVDFVIIMTYEWGWSGGPPLPVAPLNQVRAVINYAVSVIPPKKIMMGMPLYGYNWALPYEARGGFAPRVSPQEAIRIAARFGVKIEYDIQAQSPFFNYTDQGGVRHIVWFEDARSAQAKYRLASQYGLRGVSYWVLGEPFPQNWEVLDDMFKIEKVIR